MVNGLFFSPSFFLLFMGLFPLCGEDYTCFKYLLRFDVMIYFIPPFCDYPPRTLRFSLSSGISMLEAGFHMPLFGSPFSFPVSLRWYY